MNAAAAISRWVGRTRQDQDEVAVAAVRRLAVTLDRDPAALTRGGELPESWYAILFAPLTRHSALGTDGHPATGDFLPPLGGMRRVFGGRRTTFIAPLRIGEAVERRSTVTGVATRTGRRGPLTLVTVSHAISGASGLAVTEEQDIIYRTIDGAAAPRPADETPGTDDAGEWSRTLEVDPVLVFRYSALTFNAHRIHYDLPYAREVEGYPALLVNGGLTALLLIEAARPRLPQPIACYAARAMRPLFVGERVTLSGRLHAGGAELWAASADGGVAYRVELTFPGAAP